MRRFVSKVPVAIVQTVPTSMTKKTRWTSTGFFSKHSFGGEARTSEETGKAETDIPCILKVVRTEYDEGFRDIT